MLSGSISAISPYWKLDRVEVICKIRGENYTGLDISPSVARFYHKKFVLGSATAMPFPDNSFDGIWSIWVFEHVPNPEQAFRRLDGLRETRECCFCFRPGIVLLGLPRVTKSDPIPISI